MRSASVQRLLLGAVAILVWPAVVAAQGTRHTGSRPVAVLTGFVLRDDASEQPLAGAEVGITDINLSARTDSTGRFRIADVPLGVHRITVRLVGYSALSTQLTFGRAEPLERDFLLRRHQAVALDTIAVRAKSLLSAFDERRRLGNGHFITRAQLDKQHARKMSEVLSQLPGLHVRRGHFGRAWVASGRGRISLIREYQPTDFERQQGARPGCYAHVYLDGAIVSSGREPLFDINSLSTVDIEAIEYYAGGAQIPAQFNRTGSACGVLLIWTRMR